jgi:hypothetical protein
MCILTRYGEKFNTTSLAKGGGRLGAPHKRNPDLPRARAWIKRHPGMDQTLIQINTRRIRARLFNVVD